MKTWLTDVVGIKHPIIQGPMGNVSVDAGFVAAVCNAGALGILATVDLSAEGTREAIRQIRALTDQPFGVNLVPLCLEHDAILAVMTEERVPVFSHGRGNAAQCVKAAKSIGSLAIPTVGALKHAVKCEEAGADAVIVTGTEGGGHASHVGTMVLVPAVIRAVKIPVIAGGGIAVPEHLAAALALGAEGIEMGTRFMVTKEARIHPNAKQYIIKLTEEDTIATHRVTGRHTRMVANRVVRSILEGAEDKKVDNMLLRTQWMAYRGPATVEGQVEDGFISAGQGIGLIGDCPTVAELITRMVDGAAQVLRDLPRFL